jgi:DNA-binding NarL/FixJ family response regulator
MTAKRIIIADDHEVVRSGLCSVLKAHKDWEIVAEADNGKDAIALLIEHKPDVAIIDYSLPLINGIEVTRSVKARQINTEVLLFTMHDSDVLAKEAFKAGAKGFVEIRRQPTAQFGDRSIASAQAIFYGCNL